MGKPLPALFNENVSLKPYCTYGIGGRAKFLAKVETVEQMQECILALLDKGIPYVILGKGSNTLFSDKGYEGAVIINAIRHIMFVDTKVDVGAGFSFPLLASKTARKGLSGLEFAIGIPGTVGGAVYMNAGAGGKETKDVLSTVTFLDAEGKMQTLPVEKLEMRYRRSCFHKMTSCLLSATFCLEKREGVRGEVERLIHYRKGTQPYQAKTCGCLFRNPEGFSAGRLIEEAGLKGYQVGGVMVSTKHANFIENVDGGSAGDVLSLMSYIEEKVLATANVELKREVCYIGEPHEEV